MKRIFLGTLALALLISGCKAAPFSTVSHAVLFGVIVQSKKKFIALLD